MARMHSKSKGKSGSKKPLKKVPSWTPYQDKEVEKLIIKYAKMGIAASEIGLHLRDTCGIGSVKALTGKSITAVLEENKLSKKLPEDVMSLVKKLIAVQQHLEKNKHDQTAKRGIILTTSKLRKLISYHQKKNKIPKDWKLDITRLKMYLE